VTGYAEEVVPCFNEKDFLEHFRITRGMFEEIFPAVADEITSKNPGGHEEIDPAKQLLIFLTYLSNQKSMRELSQYFGVGQSTVHGIIKRVNKAIVTRFSELLQ
jgi:DNA-binding MarR family transcriptional regulator